MPEEELDPRDVPVPLARRPTPIRLAQSVGPIHRQARMPQQHSVLADGYVAYAKKTTALLFLESKMNVLLGCIPFVLIGQGADWSDGCVFILALLSMCPLAERISFVTEDLSKCTNDTLGGLINATMGNITELIVSLLAILHAGKDNSLLRVVQVSLAGSIFSNLLLVLGCACLAGGLRYERQFFNKQTVNANNGVMALAVMAVLLPGVLDATGDVTDAGLLALSRVTSVTLLLTYGALIFYQLHTHKHIIEGQSPGRQQADAGEDTEDDDDDEGPSELGLWGALFWLALISVLLAVLSSVVVNTIETAAHELGFPILFIGAILLPIVGNAAEHAAAVILCWRGKPDLALNIAAGSAQQIAIFVIPLCVVLAWIVNQPLSLDFHVFETVCMFMTVIISSFIMSAGDSDWFRGAMLLAAYGILSAAFWVHKDAPEEGSV